MITMVYVGETLLITPYDDIEFGKYKSNEGYLSAKKVVPSVAEYIATNHISVDKMFIRSQRPGHARARPCAAGTDSGYPRDEQRDR